MFISGQPGLWLLGLQVLVHACTRGRGGATFPVSIKVPPDWMRSSTSTQCFPYESKKSMVEAEFVVNADTTRAACAALSFATPPPSACSCCLFILLLLNAAHTALAGVVCRQKWEQGSRAGGGEATLAMPSLTVIFRSSPSLTCPIVRPRVSESESRRGRGRGRGGEREWGVGGGVGHGPCRAERRRNRPRPTERDSTLNPQPYIPIP